MTRSIACILVVAAKSTANSEGFPLHLQEELILRNVNPFGVVFSDPNAVIEPRNSPTEAYCATGEYGELEHWEKVFQDGMVFYYCKEKHISQWEPPCVHLDGEKSHDETQRYPFPITIKQIDDTSRSPNEHMTTPYDTIEEVISDEDLEEEMHLYPQDLELVQYEEMASKFCAFRGRLDHLESIAFRQYLTTIPHEIQSNVISEFSDRNLESSYKTLLREIIGIEQDMEYQYSREPDLFIQVLPARRELISSKWYELGLLSIARGNATSGVDGFRRSIHWNPKNSKAYFQIATILSSLHFIEDSCECLSMLLKSNSIEAPYWSIRIQFTFHQCKNLIQEYTGFPPFVLLVLEIILFFILIPLWIIWYRRTKKEPSIEDQSSTQSADKRRKNSNKKKN